MPDMDGLESLRCLPENEDNQRLLMIMLTSVPPQEGEQESAQLGAVHYITKPLEYDTLIAAVRSTLKRAESDNLDNIVIATHGRLPALEKCWKEVSIRAQ